MSGTRKRSRFQRQSTSIHTRRDAEITRSTGHHCNLQDVYHTNKISPNPSLWTLLVYSVRKWTTISKYHPLTKQVFRSTKKIEEERIRHTVSPYWFIIHPFSMAVLIWHEFFMTMVYLVTMFIDLYMCVPVMGSALSFDGTEYFYLCLNIFYLFTIATHFMTGYLKVRQVTNLNIATGTYQSKETEIILKPKKIALRYFFTFFLIDICPAISYPSVYLLATNNDAFEHFVYQLFFVRMFRLLRLITVSKNLNSIILFCNLGSNSSRLIVYVFWFWIFLFILVLNLLCIPSIILHFYNLPKISSPIFKKFVHMYGERNTRSLNRLTIFLLVFIYIGRALLSASDVTQIYESPGLENVIHTLIHMWEIIIRTSGIIIAFNLISSTSVSSLNYKAFRSEMNKFLVRSQIDPELYSQVSSYLESTLRKEYFNETEILKTLQTHMQYEIFNQTSTNFIRNCPLFYEVPDVIITNLALRLKFETCPEGKRILSIGEIATCMYFIASGTFAVYNKEGTEICHLYDADYFGEIALLEPYSRSFRTADVIALEYSHVFRLYVKDFDEVIKPGTELYNRISRIATSRAENRPLDDD